MSDALPPESSRALFLRSPERATPDVTRSMTLRPTPAPGPDPCALPRSAAGADADAVVCERCGVGMFRMHAVWRCPGCGYKTDCCGW
jgi:hypothetical protein